MPALRRVEAHWRICVSSKRPYQPLAESADSQALHDWQGLYLGIKWDVLQAPLSTQPDSTTLGHPEQRYTMKLVGFSACHLGALETSCSLMSFELVDFLRRMLDGGLKET